MTFEELQKQSDDSERKMLLSWMSKFCTHIDNPNPQSDEENYEFFKRKLKEQFGWTFEDD